MARNLIRNRLNLLWHNMHDRCNNPHNKRYHRYGGRGIKVDPVWETFEPFYLWAIERYRPGLQIDREKNDQNYNPANCRFVTCATNNQNRNFCKLDAPAVARVKRRLLNGEKSRAIAAELQVSSCLIINIGAGRKWRDIEPEPAAT